MAMREILLTQQSANPISTKKNKAVMPNIVDVMFLKKEGSRIQYIHKVLVAMV